jgi:hypothetical protein
LDSLQRINLFVLCSVSQLVEVSSMSKEILYIPTGEIVKMFTEVKNEDGNYEVISAGEYIDSGKFEAEFGTFDFYNKNSNPVDLFIAFISGEILDGGNLIFSDHVYKLLKITEEAQLKLHRSEFEIIDV